MPADWADTAAGLAGAFVPGPAPGLFPELQADAASTRTIPAANPGTAFRCIPYPAGRVGQRNVRSIDEPDGSRVPLRSWPEAPEATKVAEGAVHSDTDDQLPADYIRLEVNTERKQGGFKRIASEIASVTGAPPGRPRRVLLAEQGADGGKSPRASRMAAVMRRTQAMGTSSRLLAPRLTASAAISHSPRTAPAKTATGLLRAARFAAVIWVMSPHSARKTTPNSFPLSAGTTRADRPAGPRQSLPGAPDGNSISTSTRPRPGTARPRSRPPGAAVAATSSRPAVTAMAI